MSERPTRGGNDGPGLGHQHRAWARHDRLTNAALAAWFIVSKPSGPTAEAQRAKRSPGLSNRGLRWVIYGDVWRENAQEKTPRRSDTIPKHKSGKARIEAPMREARSSPPAHRGARVIRTDALRFMLILQEPRGGQERKQDSEDDPDY